MFMIIKENNQWVEHKEKNKKLKNWKIEIKNHERLVI